MSSHPTIPLAVARPFAPWAYSWRDWLSTASPPQDAAEPEGLLGALLRKAHAAQAAAAAGEEKKDEALADMEQTKKGAQQEGKPSEAESSFAPTYEFALYIATCKPSVFIKAART
jgi:hypothetical protein